MFVTQLTRVFEGLSGKVVRIKDLHWLAISQSHGSKGAWEFKRQKKDNCCSHIQCVLETQVNDQKTQRQLTAASFSSYESAVVNYRWRYFSILLVFLGSIESQKSNCKKKKSSYLQNCC